MPSTAPDPVAASLEDARPHALRLAVRLSGGDRAAAEDLVEDVVARLWERRHADGEPYAVGYVVRSVHNAARTVWRRRRLHERRLPLLAPPASSPSADEQAVDRLDVLRLLDGLAPRERQLLTLRYIDGLSQQEVSARLGIPLGSVASGSARALGRLRVALAA